MDYRYGLASSAVTAAIFAGRRALKRRSFQRQCFGANERRDIHTPCFIRRFLIYRLKVVRPARFP